LLISRLANTTDVHINELFQCQACNKVFDYSQGFEKHAIEVHGCSNHYSSKSNKNIENIGDNNNNNKGVVVSDNDDIEESKLLRQTNEEEKARKRTRGQYRKSSRHLVIIDG
jgi:uncharacterized C2H2 Zn-finger protein